MNSSKVLLALASLVLMVSVANSLDCVSCVYNYPIGMNMVQDWCIEEDLDEDNSDVVTVSATKGECYYVVWYDSDGDVTSAVRGADPEKTVAEFEAENKDGDVTVSGMVCEEDDYCNGASTSAPLGIVLAIVSLFLVKLF